jgi:ribosomal protein L11 methyltransferase
MGKSWIHIEIACAPEIADDLAAQVAEELQVGVEVAAESVQFYLQKENCSGGWEQQLQAILEDFGKVMRVELALTFTCSNFLEEDWAERWKAHFKPLRVGSRFLVCPTWERVEPGPRDRVIRIDPGRAFGTGHHETTRLCLEWIESWEASQGDLKSRSFLDVGTGSGILAIGAALLGCNPVVGVDNDPEAIEVAAENIGLNRMDGKVELREGSAADVSGRFDVVISNIQAFPLMEMAPVLTERVSDSGVLALSGILTEQKTGVESAYASEGMELCEVRIDGEWCLLVLKRRK